MKALSDIKKVGKQTLSLLHKLSIETLEDLLFYYPFRYDIIKRSDLKNANQDDKIVIDGVVGTIPTVFYIHRNLNKMSFKLSCEELLQVTIFNRAFLKSHLTIGKKITVIGKYDKKHHQVVASDIYLKEIGNQIEIHPIYHMVYGLSNHQLHQIILEALKEDLLLEDNIPMVYQEKYHFLSKEESLNILHNPKDIPSLKKARLRTKYEEMFVFMLQMNYLKKDKKNKLGLSRSIDRLLIDSFVSNLPFTLTEDQKKAVDQIYEDLTDEKRMNRLLQGDVGSGKTIVAVIAMYMNFLSGYQSALMAPTEILAVQHYQTIQKLLEKYPIKVALLTGKTKAKERKEIYRDLENGEISILIGTHALISEKVMYHNLGLVITDEQHRFGVNQRSNLKNKGLTPDILYMSATPIPRTYALTLYGDMDISNIRTKPSGRKDVITRVKSEKEIRDVLEAMYEQLKEKHQIYVIAPLIEESDKIDLTNVNDLYEHMQKAFGKVCTIGLLHGKMKNQEKEEVMDSFSKNEIQILISTTVVEVGVDVPNATMMVIFDAFRFGLSALHQLRGRVGRNSFTNYCYLISNQEVERLKIMTQTNDGFKISEEDFKMRGSGDLFGVRQSGDMEFKVADFRRDFNILLKAKEDSEEFLKENFDDPICQKIIGKMEHLD